MNTLFSSDTIIVGAGIGGTCAALSLAERGAEVTLLEAGDFPRHKVCGEFLSPESRAIFKRLGVEDALLDAGALPVGNARVVARSQELDVPLPPGGLALSRYRLDEILWRAANARGIGCHSHTRVHQITGSAEEGFKAHASAGVYTGRTAIAAPGRGASLWHHKVPDSQTTRYLGLKAHFRGVRLEPGTVELHPWRGGYCGLVRVEEGLTDVCLLARYDVVQQRSKRAPEAFWQWLLTQCPALAERFTNAEVATPWLATGNVSFGRQAPTEAGVLQCGDAAGFIHPFAGDGMAMAARSGELAGATVSARLRGSISPNDTAALYDAAWRREFSPRLDWATRLQPLLISPLLTTLAAPIFARAPRLARFAVRRTRGR
jgi:flavin-dependent dehydrogenase